ncbi:MAG: alpha/beta hydrolase family protein [Cyclobacteriaceae bacterium]
MMSLKRTGIFIGLTIVILAVGAVMYIMYQIHDRPQKPSRPYPYYTEDVAFENSSAGITLAGTLTLPSAQGNFPAAILISGSGPQNRDEEIAGHRPFLIIANHLTKQGVAVLRCDDRGVGQSTGDFQAATTADFATDVAASIQFLKSRKEINTDKIGLIGHSEGGMVAPLVASKSEDVSFMVMLAGPGIDLVEVIMMQKELVSRADGVSESDIKKWVLPVHEKACRMITTYTDTAALKADLKVLIEKAYDKSPPDLMPSDIPKEEVISTQVKYWSSDWYRYFLKYDPAAVLEKVSCPVLALNGEKDLQVTPEENLSAIDNAFKKGGNTNVTVKELPNLNHLFQNCETGSPEEYEKIEETFSPIALKEMSDWILEQVQ